MVVSPAHSSWTFHPDEPDSLGGPDAGGGEPESRSEPAMEPRRGAPRVAVVGIAVSLVALVVGLLGATHTWPFRPSAPAAASPSHAPAPPQDIRGTWNAKEVFSGTSTEETLLIEHERLSTGVFSGMLKSPIGTEMIHGTVVSTKISFTITFGTTTISGTASVAGNRGHLSMVGSFSNALGSRGLLVATQASA